MDQLESEKMDEMLDTLWLRIKRIAEELNEATGIGVLVATRFPDTEFNGFSGEEREELYLNILPKSNGPHDRVKVKPQDCQKCCWEENISSYTRKEQGLFKSANPGGYPEGNGKFSSGIKMEFNEENDELEVIPDINTIESIIKGEYEDIKGGVSKEGETQKDSFYPWDCPVCGKTIRSHVNRHLKSHPNFEGIEDVLSNNKKALKVIRDSSNMQYDDEQEGIFQDSNLLEELDLKGEVLKSEENSKNPYKPTECTVCGKIIRSNMKRHMRSHPGYESAETAETGDGDYDAGSKTKKKMVNYVDCSVCGKPVKSDYLSRHLRTHDPQSARKGADDEQAITESFACYCGKSFKNAIRLKSHVLHNHKEKRFKCDQCDMAFYKQTGLSNHLWVHKEGKHFKCDVCGKEFKNPGVYKSHMYRHRHGISYDCTICNKTFATKKSSELHRIIKHTETDIAPHLCPECGKGFFHPGNFKRHLLLHKGIKRFKCEDCGLSFSQNTQLHAHRVVHGIPNAKKPKSRHCEICGKEYSSAGNLFLHMRRHSNDKRYKCQECGKAFHSSGNYKRHMMLHTGDKPFTCDSCGKDFRQLVALKAHIRTHTGEKPYKCTYCPSEYSDSRGLKKHLNTHVGQQPKQEMQLYG